MIYEDITVEYLTYTALQGDTWDAIAIDFYGDPNQSYILINANPAYSSYITLPGGVELKVPIIPDNVAPSNLPPWKAVQ